MAGMLLVGALVAGTPGPATAVSEACWDDVPTDVDGGGPDAVLGLPSYDLPGKPDAGAIVVFSNVAAAGEADPSPPAARTLLTADDFPGLSTQTGARFGSSVVVWGDSRSDDVDDCADLLVGAPGQTVDGKVGAGRVFLLTGTVDGLGGVRLVLDESTLAGTGGPQAGAGFGASIAAASQTTIAVGAPGRDVGGAVDAGRVVRLDYRGSSEPDVVVVEQGGSNAGRPESYDRFGEVLELMHSIEGSILVVGIPREDVGNRTDAGAVGMMPPNRPLSLVTQDSPGAGGAAEAGDLYGAAIDSYVTVTTHTIGVIVVGVPGEDVKGKADAGMVSFASFDMTFDPEFTVSPIAGWSRTLTQDSPGVRGVTETGDQYGSAVLAGEFGQERLSLVVTSPLEDLGDTVNAGLVAMTLIQPEDGSPTPGAQPGAWTQDSAGVAGRAERGDRFGTASSSVLLTSIEDDFDVVWRVAMTTVPREDVGGVADAGMAYLGVAPGARSIALVPPVRQAGAGLGMVPMQIG